MRVSGLFLSQIELAVKAARLTEGRVDPTVGTAMRVLGYDRDFSEVVSSNQELPAAHAATMTVGRVPGWQAIGIDPERRRVRIPLGVELDLGATAKAACADWVAGRAAQSAGCGVLADLGGDIAVAGPPPEDGWAVRVADRHDAPAEAPGQTVAIRSGGLATSGTAARRWQTGGRVVHHLVDPATGLPAVEHWRTVSVAAGSCADANIASTAAVILGPAAPAWLEERGLPARLVCHDGTVVHTAGWPSV
jgi:thiamine biosynthesis lipoprotein